jgi:hypothetical protein
VLSLKLAPGIKHVLQCLAYRACGLCGHARPSAPLLALDTGMSERSVRDALVELRQNPQLLKVWAYSKGGRGVTTEYIVMPELAKLSTTDCPDWGKHSNTMRRVQGIDKSVTAKPGKIGFITLRQTSYHPSIHTHPSGNADPKAAGSAPGGTAPAWAGDATGLRPEVEPPTPPGPLPDNPIDQPAPTLPQSPAEACADAIRLLTRGTHVMPGTGRNRKPQPPS